MQARQTLAPHAGQVCKTSEYFPQTWHIPPIQITLIKIRNFYLIV